MPTREQYFMRSLPKLFGLIDDLPPAIEGNETFEEISPDAFSFTYTRAQALQLLESVSSINDWKKGDRILKFWIISQAHKAGETQLVGLFFSPWVWE